MIWHAKTKQFLYRGRIIGNCSDYARLLHEKKLSFFAMPVPRGRIVEFSEIENLENIPKRYALYKINVKMKEGAV